MFTTKSTEKNIASRGASFHPYLCGFFRVLSAYQKSDDPDAAHRADEIVRRMEQLYECGEMDTPPDTYVGSGFRFYVDDRGLLVRS